MCDSILSLPFASGSAIKFRRLGFARFGENSPLTLNSLSFDRTGVRNGCALFPPRTRVTRSLCAFVSRRNRFSDELEFKGKEGNLFNAETSHKDASREDMDENSTSRNEIDPTIEGKGGDGRGDEAADLSGLNFVDSEGGSVDVKKNSINSKRSLEGGDLVGLEDNGAEMESGRIALRKRRQVMRRWNMIAKQVISIQSALSLGFVSQLWVDTAAWMVLFVEVKPNLLSGESEWFLLEDIRQVGDVVLVEDETVMENEFKMVGLETLVGYKVVTPGRRNIGKIRGYTLNINSGAVESLELDSFGYSFLPSSLVSTYALLVEDVVEVISDVVIVHEDAASRIQRLTKGFIGTQQHVGRSPLEEEVEEHYEFERHRFGTKFRKTRDINSGGDDDDDNVEELHMPMDYL